MRKMTLLTASNSVVTTCRFNRTFSLACGKHPQFFKFLTVLERDIIHGGITTSCQADAGNYIPPDKMSTAEKELVELSRALVIQYQAREVSATYVLRTSASQFNTNSFKDMYKEMNTVIHTETGRYLQNGGALAYEPELEEGDGDEGRPSPSFCVANRFIFARFISWRPTCLQSDLNTHWTLPVGKQSIVLFFVSWRTEGLQPVLNYSPLHVMCCKPVYFTLRC